MSSNSNDMSQHQEGGKASKTKEIPASDISAALGGMGEEDEGKYDNVELEETDCPLCHFMRASPCGQTWVRWEKCIHYHKEKEEDFVGPCGRVTLKLAECIQIHKDDFPPTLRQALLSGGEDDDVEEGDKGEEAKEQVEAAATNDNSTTPESAAAATEVTVVDDKASSIETTKEVTTLATSSESS